MKINKNEDQSNKDVDKTIQKDVIKNEIDECQIAIISNEYLDILVEYEGFDEIFKKYEGKCYQIVNDNLAIIHVKVKDMDPLASYKVYVDSGFFPDLYGPYGKSSMEASGILSFHTQPSIPLRGEGVLIGIIDSGIDYTHSVFHSKNNSKIISIWDQTIQGNPPDGFIYGREYLKDDINRALKVENPYEIVPSKDMTGHGTFLAGMAAGNEVKEENFIGAAPDAELVIVKLKEAKQNLKTINQIYTDSVYQATDIIMGVKYLSEKANALNRPIVIVIGLGTNGGGHDGSSVLEEYLNSIGKIRGNVVVVAAGNEANKGHHYEGEFKNDELYKDIEIYVAAEEEGLTISIWGNRSDLFSIAITSPTGEFIEKISPRLSVLESYELILEKTTIFINYVLLGKRTGDQFIFLSLNKPTEGIWTIRVYGDLIVDGSFNIWLSRSGWINEKTRFLQPDPFTTVTTPSTSINLITCGAYNHEMDSLYVDSGRGLTRDNELKPDLVAPGVNIYGPLPENRFGSMTGTSISAAITGGASALLLEWGIILGKDKQINTLKVKNYLRRGAIRKPDIPYPNRQWGFGELNLLGTYQAIRGSKI